MRIFHYEKESGALIGSSEALESPMEKGVFLVPAQATKIEPIDPLENHTINFNGSEWVHIPIQYPIPKPIIPVDRKAEILQELQLIDEQSVRPARAVAVALATNAAPDAIEIDKLAKLEAKALALRSELSSLN